jgi:hypothetical protein
VEAKVEVAGDGMTPNRIPAATQRGRRPYTVPGWDLERGGVDYQRGGVDMAGTAATPLVRAEPSSPARPPYEPLQAGSRTEA